MGSPFQSVNTTKVSVVRTEYGAYQSLATAVHHARISIDVRICRVLIAAAYLRPSSFREDIFGDAEWHRRVDFPEALCSALDELTGGEMRMISEYLSAFATALQEKGRLVHVMSARYDWEGSENFNRAVVFDMTRNDGFPRVMPYNLPWELIPFRAVYANDGSNDDVGQSKTDVSRKE